RTRVRVREGGGCEARDAASRFRTVPFGAAAPRRRAACAGARRDRGACAALAGAQQRRRRRRVRSRAHPRCARAAGVVAGALGRGRPAAEGDGRDARRRVRSGQSAHRTRLAHRPFARDLERARSRIAGGGARRRCRRTGMKLLNQVALVTGASRGIGRAIPLELARQGASVVCTATGAAGVQAISSAFAQAGLAGRGHVFDVTDASACEALVESLIAEGRAPAILVNNAGITRDNLALRMKDEEWSEVIATNLDAVFRLTRLVLRPMTKARYGRIVNIGSVVGSSGNAGQANYAAAKAGVAGMSRALARELASRNITVNCVAPGFVDTDMTRALSEAQANALVQQIPAGRFGQPDDVAAAVAFLASPQAGYITGVTLHVNGGMYME